METYRNNKYTITTSLSDRHIIINITNNVSYACYEGKYENSAFRLSFDNTAIFKLVNKCFAEFVEPTGKSTYKVNIALSENTGAEHLVLDFDCVVEGFLAVAFKLRMVEKTVIAGDKGLIIELNRQKQLVSELTSRMAEMERTMKMKQALPTVTANIIASQKQMIEHLEQRANHAIANGTIMSSELDKKTKMVEILRDHLERQDSELAELVKKNEILHRTANVKIDALSNAYNLLYPGNDINTCAPTYCYKMNSTTVEISAIIYSGSHIAPYYPKIKLFYNLELLILRRYRFPDLTNFSNSTVKKIKIDCFGEHPSIQSLAGIENFPELEIIEVQNCCITDLLGQLTTCKHKIKSLVGFGDLNGDIKRYCQMNNIEFKSS